MIIVSEVENPGKRASRVLRNAGRFLLTLCFFWPVLGGAGDGLSVSRLGDCNWQVNYRGHTYDLSPLTREALARPLENDIRYALQRVPESNNHLELMGTKLRAARAHTIIASIFITGFLATKILQSGAKNFEDRQQYGFASTAAGGLFLAATLFSWRSSTEAKEELVRAVEEFNVHSPHKIEPAVLGDLKPE